LGIKHGLNGWLHASDFFSGKSPTYAHLNLTPDQRVQVAREMFSLIHRSIPLGIIVTVDAVAFNKIMKRNAVRTNAQIFCLARAVTHVINRMPSLMPGCHGLSVICDSGPTAMHMYGAYSALKKQERTFDETVAAIAFADDRAYQPLQAADLLACLSMWREQVERGGPKNECGSFDEIIGPTLPGRTLYVEQRIVEEHIGPHAELLKKGMSQLYLP
jgi:hypothetical protein